MPKQTEQQRFIYKIHSSRLARNNWDLILPLDEARKNDEVISLASSQVLRWIDELNGVKDADRIACNIRHDIKNLRKDVSGSPSAIKKEIKRLYRELDKVQYKPDYMCLIIDKNSHYYRACKGFKINGIKYRRLLATNGGVKNSTIIFVSENVFDELNRRIENGRNPEMMLVPAKLEAYKALACSASIPVSMPDGILVVDDAETEFFSDVTYLSDENSGEPVMEFKKNEKIKLDATDGFGLMLPSLASKWSIDLGLDYMVSGVNTRFSFEKGMVYTFDFIEFANKVAGKYIVRDAWGRDVDIRSVELVLTTSMLKLWDSYESCDDYIEKSVSNGYTFGIAKACPESLESERHLNYQFIQSYELTDDDIDELIKPTVDEFKEVLGGDWRKTVLFLRGLGLTENNIGNLEDDYIKALMIDHRLESDPYIQTNVFQLIKNKINEAKVGVIKVHGNYSIASGDPYTLCQSMFGMNKTGLLKAGEIFNRYWADAGSEVLSCFRAPMTCHSNIRRVVPVRSEDAMHWYQYMNTCTIFNSWDTAMAALNGMDFDGDLVMLTDNHVLVSKLRPQPALMCAQRKASKIVPLESDFVRSNIASFGNEIGRTTNWITSMFEVRSHFDPDSEEFKALTYRIQCGQLYQQNAIDKAKGIVCKPMPREWHDRHSANKIEPEKERLFYRSIVADKKPYFMRYVYPSLMKEYNTYIKNTNRNALREFQMTVNEIVSIPYSKLTERQKEFLKYYDYNMPVGVGDCVMNKICRKFEEAFDGFISRFNTTTDFDYTIMKSDAEYTTRQFYQIKDLYKAYNNRLSGYEAFISYEKVDESDAYETLTRINEDFMNECHKVCMNDDALCNIVLDICYTRSSTKRFAWSMCGTTIINNLLKKNNYTICFPTEDEEGDIEYCGSKFRLCTSQIGARE